MDIPTIHLLPNYFTTRPGNDRSIFRDRHEECLNTDLYFSRDIYRNRIRVFFNENDPLSGTLSTFNNYSRNTPIPSYAEYFEYFSQVAGNLYYNINLWDLSGNNLYPNLDNIFNFFPSRTRTKKKCYFYMIVASNILSFLDNYDTENREYLKAWMTHLLRMNAGPGYYRDRNVPRHKIDFIIPCDSGRDIYAVYDAFERLDGRQISPKILITPFQAYLDSYRCMEDGGWAFFWKTMALVHQKRMLRPRSWPSFEEENIDPSKDYFHGLILDSYLNDKQKEEDISKIQLMNLINHNEYSMETLDKIYEILSGKENI